VYDDIEQTAAIGGAAVGLWEGKFGDGDDQKIADFMAEHGIAASFCVPQVHSILGRHNAERHLSFGKGVHFCIGAPLAQAETVQAVAALFERIPDLRLADDDIEEWVPHMTLPRRKTLRLEWR
jgi:hypothetical protein